MIITLIFMSLQIFRVLSHLATQEYYLMQHPRVNLPHLLYLEKYVLQRWEIVRFQIPRSRTAIIQYL